MFKTSLLWAMTCGVAAAGGRCAAGGWSISPEKSGAEKARALLAQAEQAVDAGSWEAAQDVLRALDKELPNLPRQKVSDQEKRRREAMRSVKKSDLRPEFLGWVSFLVLGTGDCESARAYAVASLAGTILDEQSAAENRYYANHTLGLIALSEGDIARAKDHLRASVGVAFWRGPAVSSLGPNLLLCKRLLDQGESLAVLSFLEYCRRIWPERSQDRVDLWIATIKAGAIPDFRSNLTLMP